MHFQSSLAQKLWIISLVCLVNFKFSVPFTLEIQNFLFNLAKSFRIYCSVSIINIEYSVFFGMRVLKFYSGFAVNIASLMLWLVWKCQSFSSFWLGNANHCLARMPWVFSQIRLNYFFVFGSVWILNVTFAVLLDFKVFNLK